MEHGAASKAAGLLSTVAMLKKLVDKSHFARFMASLPPETREIINVPPSDEAWLPIQHWMNLVETAHFIAFDGDIERLPELAQLATVADLKTIHRFAARLASVSFIMERAERVWQTYTRHNGTLLVTPKSPLSCEVRFHEVPAAAILGFLPFQRGVVTAMLSLSSARAYSVREMPEENGDKILLATWTE
jgi:hypothetical protein